MCEFTSTNKKVEAIRFFQQRRMNVSISLLDFKRRFAFQFEPGRCPICGVYLSKKDMRPAGRATRSMCVTDYENLIANNIKKYCFVCQSPLPPEKAMKQLKNPREIKHHIEDGECMSLWTIMHNIVLGETDIQGALGVQVRKQIETPLGRLIDEVPMYKGKPVRLIV